MKRSICLSLLLGIVFIAASCGQTAPPAQNAPLPQAVAPADAAESAAPPQSKARFSLSIDEYPRVDGSTANLPLMIKVLSAVTGLSETEAEGFAHASTTPNAYINLLERNADLLLVYEPAHNTKEIINASPVDLEFIPIGRDALVFIANERNPVTGLTQAQLIDIYTDKIRDWSAVGGTHGSILAFQRVAESGSQALFIKLLMGTTVPMPAPTELAPGEMGELIEKLAEYNNTGEALGFSVYYYAKNMYVKPGLKMLEVDGVAPGNDTIADGSYPLVNDFYAVIRKNEPANSPARALAQWLTTPEGKRCISDAGYVPIQ